MNKTPAPSILTNLKRIIGLLFITLIVAGLCYHFTKSPSAQNTATPTIQPSANLMQIGDDWWEATRLIYHGIPTRIVFLLPQASGTHPDDVNQS
ncbi:MAG: hypothetical protein PF482_05565, partial [Desulfobacteraceae bacterium]|nr:hypothetical protein [Desulfobacteraceae bacterium]